MTRRSVLSSDQIEEAKRLRRSGKSKREIAYIFDVSPTAIWDNVFASKKREVRVYQAPIIKKEPDLRPPCLECGIKLTRDVRVYHPSPVSIYQVPSNFKMGDRCLGCYLKSKGLTHMDLVNY